MLVDQQEFFQSIIFADSHQCKSLKFAVAMSGLHASGESMMAGECYTIAQYHTQRALGLLDGSSFLNIESVQASLLIARYEFIHYSGPKGALDPGKTDAIDTRAWFRHVGSNLGRKRKTQLQSLAITAQCCSDFSEDTADILDCIRSAL